MADSLPYGARCPNCDYALRYSDSNTHRDHRCPAGEERRAAYSQSVVGNALFRKLLIVAIDNAERVTMNGVTYIDPSLILHVLREREAKRQN